VGAGITYAAMGMMVATCDAGWPAGTADAAAPPAGPPSLPDPVVDTSAAARTSWAVPV